jgi:hypothetical protein
VDPKENRITIEREKGTLQTYDPRRLSGVSVHREVEREFSKGDRIKLFLPRHHSRQPFDFEQYCSESDA